MTAVFLISLILGLLLAVRVMIFGVERQAESTAGGERSFRRSPAIVTAFAIVFGLSGYLLSRLTQMAPLAVTCVAVVLGAIASFAAARVVREWWKVTPEHDVDGERYALQGHTARVIAPISATQDGEVEFQVGGVRRQLRARGVGDVTVTTDMEVVIERIEDDVVYVEPWLEVEKRL